MTRPRTGMSALKARLDDLVAGARQAFLEKGSHPVTACIYLPGGRAGASRWRIGAS